MIYIIGGASRSGKSILTSRLCRRRNISFLSLDTLRGGLMHGAPKLKIHFRNADIHDAKRMLPILEGMIRIQLNDGRDYIFEGSIWRPIDVARLMKKFPGQIRACFLGYPRVPHATKLRHLQQFAGGPNDWTAKMDDAYLDNFIRHALAFSRKTQESCKKHGLRYFDVGRQFDATLNKAVVYMLNKSTKGKKS